MEVTDIKSVFLFSNLHLLFEIISGVSLEKCVSEKNKSSEIHFKENLASIKLLKKCLE